jgi:hypothetical protein
MKLYDSTSPRLFVSQSLPLFVPQSLPFPIATPRVKPGEAALMAVGIKPNHLYNCT